MQGLLNICEGTISATYTLVGSVNVNFGTLGWQVAYNRDFETTGIMVGPEGSDAWIEVPHSISFLKFATPCN